MSDCTIRHHGQTVGQCSGQVYYTERTPKHFFYKFQGYGISTTILDELKSRGIRQIQLKYYGKEKITFYKTALDQWILKGKKYKYGNDQQIILNIKEMGVERVAMR